MPEVGGLGQSCAAVAAVQCIEQYDPCPPKKHADDAQSQSVAQITPNAPVPGVAQPASGTLESTPPPLSTGLLVSAPVSEWPASVAAPVSALVLASVPPLGVSLLEHAKRAIAHASAVTT